MPNRTDSPSGPARPSRHDSPAGARSRWLPAGVALAGALSGITGVISYQHGLYVARLTRNAGLAAYLVPLVPDLMIAMSSVTLIEASRQGRRPPMAMVALVAGIGWTVAQNVAGGWDGGVGGRLIAAGIPLALVATFESLLWLLRHGRKRGAQPPAGQSRPAEPLTFDEALRAMLAAESQRRVAELLGVPRSRVQALARQVTAPAEASELNGASPDA